MKRSKWAEEQIEAIKNDPTYKAENVLFPVIEDICRIRNKQGITDRQIAKRAGMKYKRFIQILRINENTTISELVRLVNVLGLDITMYTNAEREA